MTSIAQCGEGRSRDGEACVGRTYRARRRLVWRARRSEIPTSGGAHPAHGTWSGASRPRPRQSSPSIRGGPPRLARCMAYTSTRAPSRPRRFSSPAARCLKVASRPDFVDDRVVDPTCFRIKLDAVTFDAFEGPGFIVRREVGLHHWGLRGEDAALLALFVRGAWRSRTPSA